MTKIFLIEHDLDFATILRRIFEADDFEVSWVETISEAIARISEFNPTVTIVDLHDGESIKPEDIKALAHHDDEIPILVTANYKTPELACKALSVGASDFILKPFGTREILEQVHILAGTGKYNVKPGDVDRISDSIKIATSIDDILHITLDQLTNSLHMSDSLIALKIDSSYKIVASRGYVPDPTSNTINLTSKAIDCLTASSQDPLELTTDIVSEVVSTLGIRSHRPFPIIMPLISNENKTSQLFGFALGHGGFVLEEQDILEMERFLDQVVREISSLMLNGELIPSGTLYDIEDEIFIPEVPRDEAAGRILESIGGYFTDERDLIWIRLAMDEAFNNAILHGHIEALDHPVKNFKVSIQAGPSQVRLSIEDQGDGFDHRNVPDPTADENLLSINGRGIFIMRNIMDRVYFNEPGNKVSLVKILDGKPMRPGQL